MSDNNQMSFFERASVWIKQSISIRLFTMGILILLLLIPVSMIESLIREREERQTEAIQEVSAIWGGEQTIKGLVLSVPYKTHTKVYEAGSNEKYKIEESIAYAHFLPEALKMEGELNPEQRYRGIYEVIVYHSSWQVSGYFTKPNFEDLSVPDANILWDDAVVSLGLSDLRSIQNNITLMWNKQSCFFNPGLPSNDVIGNGISVPVKLNGKDSLGANIPFSLALNFNGSTSINFVPLGKVSEFSVKSAWQNPSFVGAFLPDERNIATTGFSANWKVLHLNRPYPQAFKGATSGIDESAFGVNLFVPVDEYQKSMRSAKYAAMFITLTFLIFFFVQIINGIRIHPVQYIMVGLALCVFYTLLIAISEHLAFHWSYIIASLSIILLITLYAKSIFNDKRLTTLLALILCILYLFIYAIIQMEDYALLMGSIGIFIVLALVMYLSRKINWYAVKTQQNK
ncbi:MAG: cell envelope integrity protein CreD [Bacteroidota bacterium]|nr:cell envelope integrity protein CreD [Bacteroidota bacterium]